MPEWTYTDVEKDMLVFTSVAGGVIVSMMVKGAAVLVNARDIPDLVAHLYETAGLGVPVILDRPEPRDVLVPDPHGGEDVSVTPSPAGRPGNLPGVNLRVGGDPDGYAAVRLVGDEPLRVAVALIDAMREAEREPDPDPADVEELAEEIRGAFGADARTLDAYEVAARTALRWMKDKQVGREGGR